MNLKTILLIVACAGLGIAICLVLGWKGYAPFNGFYNMVAGFFGNFNAAEVISNPASLITIAGTGIGVAVPLVSKLSETKKQAEQFKTDAQATISNYQTELTDKTSKLESTTVNLDSAKEQITTLSASSKDWETKASTYKEQLDKLTSQYTELQKIRAADVIGNLPAGTIIPNPDGSTSAIVEKVVVK